MAKVGDEGQHRRETRRRRGPGGRRTHASQPDVSHPTRENRPSLLSQDKTQVLTTPICVYIRHLSHETLRKGACRMGAVRCDGRHARRLIRMRTSTGCLLNVLICLDKERCLLSG